MSRNPVIPYAIIAVVGILAVIIISYVGVNHRNAAEDNDNVDEAVSLNAEDIYKNQFTVQELMDGLHAPEAIPELRAQIEFISQGELSEENEKRLKQLLK